MNLLLVSIDSLRLDFVARTNAEIDTPRFDRLSASFRFSDRMFSVSSATRPVHATLFTGLYPFEHGILGQRSPRMRDGLEHLFALFEQQGYLAGGFSEAPTIFSGLSFAPWIADLGTDPRLSGFLQAEPGAPRFLFVHYWGAHTPYGATDGKALGETWRLLKSGRADVVRQRYAAAVERLFESQLVSLLSRLDLSQWCVVILSDHGESWTEEEPYHGASLRNSVLRVPLYLHVPHTGTTPLPGPLISTVDLFPTLARLFGLPLEYRGCGRDIREDGRAEPYLAQIDPVAQMDPVAGIDDLHVDAQGATPAGPGSTGLQWALFDEERKFTYDEARQEGRLERTFTEEPLDDPRAAEQYLETYARLRESSASARLLLPPSSDREHSALEQRLRDLGYLA